MKGVHKKRIKNPINFPEDPKKTTLVLSVSSDFNITKQRPEFFNILSL